jgi:mutator family transposase
MRNPFCPSGEEDDDSDQHVDAQRSRCRHDQVLFLSGARLRRDCLYRVRADLLDADSLENPESEPDHPCPRRDLLCLVAVPGFSNLARFIGANRAETLTYYGFPDIHWQKIRTNNPLERIMKEIRRRTRVVGAFPDGQSCLNLAAARLRHIAGTTWSAKCYMNMRPLYQQQQLETEAVA